MHLLFYVCIYFKFIILREKNVVFLESIIRTTNLWSSCNLFFFVVFLFSILNAIVIDVFFDCVYDVKKNSLLNVNGSIIKNFNHNIFKSTAFILLSIYYSQSILFLISIFKKPSTITAICLFFKIQRSIPNPEQLKIIHFAWS